MTLFCFVSIFLPHRRGVYRMEAMRTPEPIKPTPVRIPDDLRIWLKHQSVDNRRSMTAEIVHRLEQSRKQQEATDAKT